MATLILEYDGRRRGAVLNGRTVIGRRANSHVVIPDRSVSRVHAWIGKAGHTFFVADGGSRTGTLVNGRLVEGRRSLRDGDQIRIGTATITFRVDAELPPGVEPIEDPAASAGGDEDGIYVHCACGAPIWAPWEFGGRKGRCRHCGETIELPRRPGGAGTSDPSNDTMAGGMLSPFARTEVGSVRLAPEPTGTTPKIEPPRLKRTPSPAPPASPVKRAGAAGPSRPVDARVDADAAPRTETICGACQSPISVLEETTACPDCGVAFHADCWTENRGCSSYGCKQVGALDVKQPVAEAAVAPQAAEPAPAGRAWAAVLRAVPWGDLLLPTTGLAALAGVFAFGVPSLALAIGSVVWSVRREPKNRRMFAIVVVASAVAGAFGSGFSSYWWLR